MDPCMLCEATVAALPIFCFKMAAWHHFAKTSQLLRKSTSEKKKSCYFIQTDLTWVTYTFHLRLALYRT